MPIYDAAYCPVERVRCSSPACFPLRILVIRKGFSSYLESYIVVMFKWLLTHFLLGYQNLTVGNPNHFQPEGAISFNEAAILTYLNQIANQLPGNWISRILTVSRSYAICIFILSCFPLIYKAFICIYMTVFQFASEWSSKNE